MEPFSLVSTITAITAWAALQHVTAERTRQSMQKHLHEVPLQHRLQRQDDGSNDNCDDKNSDNDCDEISIFENDIETMRITQRQGAIVEGELETGPPVNNDDDSPGAVPSLFDRVDELPNMKRLSKFCMGAYGREYMHFFGVELPPLPETPSPGLNRHHYTFAHVNGIHLDNVLGMPCLQQIKRGVSDSFTPAFYIIRDHASRAIILALRGTFSLNDLAVDLTCEYTDFQLPADEGAGPNYKVHQGMLHTALGVVNGEVGHAIRTALEENEGFGLCLCGHSLGAGIASLLALLWSDPATSLTHARSNLPPGRRLHAYCFATPCSIDPVLSRRSRPIITALVYSSDVVGRLSLGHVLDLRNVVAWLQDRSEGDTLAKNIISRALQYHTLAFAEGEKASMEAWFFAIRSTLLANMQSDKLYPPGRVLWVNEVRGDLKMMEVETVEEVFGEMRFGTDMLSSHMPGMYDSVLGRL